MKDHNILTLSGFVTKKNHTKIVIIID